MLNMLIIVKIESKATDIRWRKNAERNRARLRKDTYSSMPLHAENACIGNTATESPFHAGGYDIRVKSSIENAPAVSDKEEKKAEKQR